MGLYTHTTISKSLVDNEIGYTNSVAYFIKVLR